MTKQTPQKGSKPNTTILIIEDNPGDITLVREMLSGSPPTSSYELIPAGTLAAGLAKLVEEDVDVVLLDLSLPDSFGFRTLTTLQRTAPHVPVIVMTGYGDESFAARARNEGAQGFISKNEIDTRMLRRMIRQGIIRKTKEDEIKATYRFLKIMNRHTRLLPMARDVVRELLAFTLSEACRIRVLDKQGHLFTLASEGFPDSPDACEECLGFGAEACRCLQVASGAVNAEGPYFTSGGSYYLESCEDLDAEKEREQQHARHACLNTSYQSVALIPIRHAQEVLGLIHLADFREYTLSREMVELLEKIAMHIGAAIKRIRTELALNERETEVFDIFENAPLPMLVVDQNFLVRTANQAALHYCGQTPEATLDQSLGRVLRCRYRKDDAKRVCPDGDDCEICPLRLLVDDMFKEPQAGRNPKTFFELYCDDSAKPRQLLLTAALLKVAGTDLVLLYIEDVTERRQQETQWQVARAMLDHARERMIVFNAMTATVEKASMQLTRELGYSRMQVKQLHYHDLVEKPAWDDVVEWAKSTEHTTETVALKKNDGERTEVTADIHPLTINNHLYVLVNAGT
ncbi:MAG: response regulator [Candidatus Pacebacteria bacterium]|nr:response regulator [Candidatus Paceibacterota bacterium]